MWADRKRLAHKGGREEVVKSDTRRKCSHGDQGEEGFEKEETSWSIEGYRGQVGFNCSLCCFGIRRIEKAMSYLGRRC